MRINYLGKSRGVMLNCIERIQDDLENERFTLGDRKGASHKCNFYLFTFWRVPMEQPHWMYSPLTSSHLDRRKSPLPSTFFVRPRLTHILNTLRVYKQVQYFEQYLKYTSLSPWLHIGIQTKDYSNSYTSLRFIIHTKRV